MTPGEPYYAVPVSEAQATHAELTRLRAAHDTLRAAAADALVFLIRPRSRPNVDAAARLLKAALTLTPSTTET